MVGPTVRPGRMAVSRVVALRAHGRLALAPLAIPLMAWLSKRRADLPGVLPLQPRGTRTVRQRPSRIVITSLHASGAST